MADFLNFTDSTLNYLVECGFTYETEKTEQYFFLNGVIGSAYRVTFQLSYFGEDLLLLNSFLVSTQSNICIKQFSVPNWKNKDSAKEIDDSIRKIVTAYEAISIVAQKPTLERLYKFH